MKRAIPSGGAWPALLLLLLGLPADLLGQAGSSSWPPVASGERLRFNLLWPSGFSLGEAVLEASRAGEQIQLQATVQADLPQHPIEYAFSSSVDEQLCSVRYIETLREGNNTRETSYEFDQENHKVRRTEGGQSSESSIPECARDPLALLYHFRRQLSFQQLPIGTPEAVGAFYLGGDYTTRYEAITPETVQLGTKEWAGDRFLIRVEGPGGERSFEVWIRPDTARTPVAVRIPFPLAMFSAELE
ncbi:MAG: DUF3108 domain-containing protein [Acidobacteria bacterium]|nr:DUF3108 domain-containing protein [Acidobacteriota bacterium]